MIFGKFLFEKKKSKRGTKRRKKSGLERGDYRVLGWKKGKFGGSRQYARKKEEIFTKKRERFVILTKMQEKKQKAVRRGGENAGNAGAEREKTGGSVGKI